MRIAIRSAALLLLILSSAEGSALHEKEVGATWTWFSDYAYFKSEWTLNAESNCELEVGWGIMAFGSPRGGTQKFKAYLQLTTYGLGAIHVRTVNGAGPCKVRLDIGAVAAIPIYGSPSLIKAAVDDANAANAAVTAQKKKQENEMSSKKTASEN